MNYFAYLIPYVAVFGGLHIFRSAWIAILSYHLGLFIVLLIGRFQWGSLLRGWAPRAGLAMTVLGFLSGIALLLIRTIDAGSPSNIKLILDGFGLSGLSLLLFCFYYPIVTPILEEAFWRGLASKSGQLFSASDVFFSGYHVIVLVFFLPPYIAAVSFVVLWITAIIWRQIRYRFGGLLIPLLSHFAADVSIMIATSIAVVH